MKLVVGFITYANITAKYLPYFLPSLFAQKWKDRNFAVLAFDNTGTKDNDNIQYIKINYPQIDILSAGRNVGFSRAYNKLIKEAAKKRADYFLAINPDVVLERQALAEMVKTMEENGELGAVSPKIFRWNFKNGEKTEIIDTFGIALGAGLRFYDLGQGEINRGQYDDSSIIGPSGAAAMYRMDALKKIKEGDEYFDEKFFMYKEDCDLAYRLFLSGYKSKCVHGAVAYHDRTTGANGQSILQIVFNRRHKNREVKKWSFFGQQVIFLKYWRRQSWRNKLVILWQEVKIITFISLFEPYLLRELWRARKTKNHPPGSAALEGEKR